MARNVSIPLTALRTLSLPRGKFSSAASGAVAIGETLYVVCDDELTLGRFDLASDRPGKIIRVLPGTLPEDVVARKAAKPDWEILAPIPSDSKLPFGGILLMPSGSKPSRVRGALFPFTADGDLAPSPTLLDFTRLYGELRKIVTELNLEGAVFTEREVLLFQRRTKASSRNAILRLRRKDLVLAADSTEFYAPVRTITRAKLGRIENTRFGFTDAARAPDQRIWFIAAAEATDSSVDDGVYRGALLGALGKRSYRVKEKWLLACPRKPEGLAFGAGGTFYVVTDADDRSEAAVVYRGQLPQLGKK